MVHRIALLTASMAAAAVLAVALFLAGFGPAVSPAVPTSAEAIVAPAVVELAADAPDVTAAPTPIATTTVDTVYIQPAAPPKTIRIVKPAKARATPRPQATQPPIVIHRVIPAARSGEGDGENEGEDD